MPSVLMTLTLILLPAELRVMSPVTLTWLWREQFMHIACTQNRVGAFLLLNEKYIKREVNGVVSFINMLSLLQHPVICGASMAGRRFLAHWFKSPPKSEGSFICHPVFLPSQTAWTICLPIRINMTTQQIFHVTSLTHVKQKLDNANMLILSNRTKFMLSDS